MLTTPVPTNRMLFAVLPCFVTLVTGSIALRAQTHILENARYAPVITSASEISFSSKSHRKQSDQSTDMLSVSDSNAGNSMAVASDSTGSPPICAHESNCHCSGCIGLRAEIAAHYAAFKRCKQASHWGYPEYFCEPELGSSVSAAFQAQKAYGLAEQSCLYLCDFFPANSPMASQLTAFGRRRLEKLSFRAVLAGMPLRIEQSLDSPELDEARRQQVLQQSSAANLGLTPDMVVLARDVRGFSGIEAILHYRNQLTQTIAGPSSGTADRQPSTSTTGANINAPSAR